MINRRAAMHLAALLGPVLLVQGFRMVFSAHPTAVAATATGEDALLLALAPPPVSAPTSEQAAALEWVKTRSLRVSASPMNHGAAPVAIDPTPTRGPEAPQLTVTSIVKGAGGVIATINDRNRRVGDTLGGGWTITDIDFRERCVTVRHPSGMTVRAYLSELGHRGD